MFELQPLPFKRDALEPFISKRTIDYHYGQHHANYVKTLNTLIQGTADENKTLKEIIKHSEGGVYNNAAQVWNHEFFWKCLTPNPKEMPEGNLMDAINRDFGGFEAFKEHFTKQCTTLFGSGWVWLVADKDDRLSVMQTHNADNPLKLDGMRPLLTCDVWEHAYYLDKQNQRALFVSDFWKIINWDFVERNYLKKAGECCCNKA